jgi:hypothetical protein
MGRENRIVLIGSCHRWGKKTITDFRSFKSCRFLKQDGIFMG